MKVNSSDTDHRGPSLSASAKPQGYDRRTFLTGTSTALAAIALAGRRAQGQDLQKLAAAKQDQSATDPGPENRLLRDASPNSFLPPVTDHGEVKTFWNSFSVQHRRVQEGGWSRQVTVEDFPISRDIAGVNMRLTAGGIRELHWHDAAEWALMLSGNARITAIDNAGKSYVKDVTVNDLWYFPTGTPHSIQGLDPDGCEFLLVFDDGKFSEGNTTLISDWTRHTPREALAKNWGVPEQGEPLPGPFTLRVGKEHATRVSNATPSNQPRNVADDSGEEGRHRACLKRNARKLFVAVRQGKAQLPAGCVALPVTGLVPPSRQFRFSKDCSRLAKVLVQTQPKTGLSILQG